MARKRNLRSFASELAGTRQTMARNIAVRLSRFMMMGSSGLGNGLSWADWAARPTCQES